MVAIYTREQIDQLAEEYGAGAPVKVIAVRLGQRWGLALTPNSIIGIANRAGLVHRNAPAKPPRVVEELPEIKEGRGCQYLHGEPIDRDFCGETRKLGSSYCERHHADCYTKADTGNRLTYREPELLKPKAFAAAALRHII